MDSRSLNGAAAEWTDLATSTEASKDGASDEELREVENYFCHIGLPTLVERPPSVERVHRVRVVLACLLVPIYAAFLLSAVTSPSGSSAATYVTGACLLVGGMVYLDTYRSWRGQLPRRVAALFALSLLLGPILDSAIAIARDPGVEGTLETLIPAFAGVSAYALYGPLALMAFVSMGGVAVVGNMLVSLRHGLRGSLGSAIRTLPVVFAVLVALFLTNETWVFFAGGPLPRFLGLLVVLTAFALTFVILSVRDDWQSICKSGSSGEDVDDKMLKDLDSRIPDARPLLTRVTDQGDRRTGLPRRARWNIRAGLAVGFAARLFVIGLITALLFALLGAARMDATLTGTMLEAGRASYEPDQAFAAWGVYMSWELIRLVVLLGALAALTVAVQMAADPQRRAEFIGDQTDRMLGAVMLWRYYAPLAERARDGGAPEAEPELPLAPADPLKRELPSPA